MLFIIEPDAAGLHVVANIMSRKEGPELDNKGTNILEDFATVRYMDQ